MRACVRDDSVRCVTWQRQAMCQRYCVAHASNVLLWTMSVTRMFVVPYGVAAGAVTSSSTSSSTPGGEHPPCYYFILLSHLSHSPAAPMDKKCARSTHI